jgi:hypothetical protein
LLFDEGERKKERKCVSVDRTYKERKKKNKYQEREESEKRKRKRLNFTMVSGVEAEVIYIK